MFLGRSRPCERLAVLAIMRATAPQEVCGAATLVLHRHREMQSGHPTESRLRWNGKSGKKTAKNPLVGVVCLLTTGGLL